MSTTNTQTILVKTADVVFGSGQILKGGQAVPIHGFIVVNIHAIAIFINMTKLVHCSWVTKIG